MKPTKEHTKDEDCTIDPETMSCIICGVDHDCTCPECGGHGFHKDNCPLSDATIEKLIEDADKVIHIKDVSDLNQIEDIPYSSIFAHLAKTSILYMGYYTFNYLDEKIIICY